VVELALWRTGESWPIARVVRTQLSLPTPSLYGRTFFSQQFNLYKYEMLQQKRPRIVVLGTSRVMQMRDFMFEPLAPSFYNAGGMVQGPTDVANYARLVRSGALPKPDVVIIGIDPWWVKREARDQGWLDDTSLRDVVGSFAAHVEALRMLMRHGRFPWTAALRGAPDPAPGYPYHGIGVLPLLQGTGFRTDGSLQISADWVLESADDPSYRDRNDVLGMVIERREPFGPPAVLDESRIDGLVGALSELQTLGVEVHAFLPPFASEVQAALESSSAWAPAWRAYRTELPARLRAAQIACLPLSVPDRDGFDDTYMYDGYHATEIYAAAIVRQLVVRAPPGSALRQVDPSQLDGLLSRDRPSPLAFEAPPGFSALASPPENVY
jgi:hypothetical protein